MPSHASPAPSDRTPSDQGRRGSKLTAPDTQLPYPTYPTVLLVTQVRRASKPSVASAGSSRRVGCYPACAMREGVCGAGIIHR
eukprot:2154948-Rhodomonas_salina.1